AGALLLVLGGVDALADVARLLADGVEHGAGVAVVAHGGVGVADIADDVADDSFVGNGGGGGDLAGHHGHAGLHQGFHGDAGVGVLLEQGVQDRIGDLVAHLVGMALGDGLGREQSCFSHGLFPVI